MQRTKAPFRADHVGSLLRTAPLKEARAKHAKGEIKDAQLEDVEDREIEKIIRKQEEIGLKLATDGEFRRSWWHFDFFKDLDGVELYSTGQGIKFAGVETKAESVRVAGKVGFSTHPHLEHFRFVKDHAKVTPKMTIPAPSHAAFSPGPPIRQQGRLSRSRCLLPRRRAGVRQGHPRLLRRRLPLPAARRHRMVDDLRSEGARRVAQARRRSRQRCRRATRA